MSCGALARRTLFHRRNLIVGHKVRVGSGDPIILRWNIKDRIFETMVRAAIEWNQMAAAIDRPNLIDWWISVAIERLRMMVNHQPVYHYGQQRDDYSWKSNLRRVVQWDDWVPLSSTCISWNVVHTACHMHSQFSYKIIFERINKPHARWPNARWTRPQ